MMEKTNHQTTTIYETSFDHNEAKKTNLLVTGANHSGKTNLACQIASILQRFDWRIVAFDSSGAWLQQSDIPHYITVNYDADSETFKVPLFHSSILYDLTLLLLVEQQQFVDLVLLDLWHQQLEAQIKLWTMVFLEESQLYCKNIRGSVAQNILRIMTVGRNQKVRVCACSPDLSLIDPAFIRLCSQRYHAKLVREENAQRKFRSTYGRDWCDKATRLQLGEFVYLLRDQLTQVSVPLFIPKRQPQPIQQNKSWIRRFMDFTEKAWNEA